MLAAAGPAGSGTALAAGGRTFYVSPGGDDAHAGTSPAAPWRTLAHADAYPLEPGDRVLLEGQSTFDEPLAPYSTSAGTAADPIRFGSYGSGRAAITRGVYLNSNAFLTFSDLDVTNTGAGAKGILASAFGSGAVGISLENLYVRDIPGFGVASDNPADTGWTITGITVERTGDSGILVRGSGFTVRGSTIRDTGTDSTVGHPRHGIYAAGPAATIEANTISGFASSGVSFRRQDTLVARNRISHGQTGIAYSPESTVPGTSRILFNIVEDVVDYGIGSAAAQTSESFVVADNTVVTSGAWGMYFQAGPSLTLANNLVLAGAPGTSYLNVRAQSGTYSEHHNLFFGGSEAEPFYWDGTARTTAQYSSASGGGSADVFGDPLLDASTLTPGPGSPAIDAGTTSVDPSLTYLPGCDGEVFHYCGTGVEIGAVESPQAGPTAVRAVNFRARAVSRGRVELTWRTASELGTLGFNVWRFAHGTRGKVNVGLIHAKAAGLAHGAAYRLLVRRVPAVVYRLEEVSRDGTRAWRARATA